MVRRSFHLTAGQLTERFASVFTGLIGNDKAVVTEISSPDNATASSLLCCHNPKAIQAGLASNAPVLVLPEKARAQMGEPSAGRAYLFSKSVDMCMTTLLKELVLATPYRDPSFDGVHPSAVIHPTAKLGHNVQVGPFAVIGANVEVGDGCSIGAQTIVNAEAKIDSDTTLHPQVYIGHSVRIGRRCEVHPSSVIGKEGFGYSHDDKGMHHRIPHTGTVVLEDDVHIGACCTIDRGTFGETRIGRNVKMDNQVHIAHNCKIGEGSIIVARFVMAGSSTIGRRFVAGGNSVVSGHLRIGDDVQISACSGVAKDLLEPGQYGGLPLTALQHHIKIKAAMVQLPEMRKHVSRLMKKIFPEEET